MKRRSYRRNSSSQEDKLQLAAMVDVVFLLLVFFVLTLQTEDILASLPVSKPGTEITPPPTPPPPMLRIQVMPDGYYANNKKTTIESLEVALTKIASYSTTQDIIIICSMKSMHTRLVVLLDICAKAKLKNLHLLSQ